MIGMVTHPLMVVVTGGETVMVEVLKMLVTKVVVVLPLV